VYQESEEGANCRRRGNERNHSFLEWPLAELGRSGGFAGVNGIRGKTKEGPSIEGYMGVADRKKKN